MLPSIKFILPLLAALLATFQITCLNYGNHPNQISHKRVTPMPTTIINFNQTLQSARSHEQQSQHSNYSSSNNGTDLYGQHINKWLIKDDMNVGESRITSTSFTDFDNSDSYRTYNNRSKSSSKKRSPSRQQQQQQRTNSSSPDLVDDLDSESAESEQVFDDADEAAGLAGTTQEPACATHGRYYCTSKEEYPYKLVLEVTKYYKWPLEKLFRDLHAQIMPKLAQESTGNLVCDSITRVVRPGWARNTNDRWLVVINTENYHQYVTEVVCQYGSNSRCNFIPPCYYSSCQQRYNTQKLLVIDPNNPYRGPFLSEFLFPSCCVCYVPSTIESTDDKYRPSPATIYQRTMQQVAASNIYPPQMKHPGSIAAASSSYSSSINTDNGSQTSNKQKSPPPYDQNYGSLAPGKIRRDGEQVKNNNDPGLKKDSNKATVTHAYDTYQTENDVRSSTDPSDITNFPHFRIDSSPEAEALANQKIK